jgi:uncharacterized protein YcbK (DUF882 family)
MSKYFTDDEIRCKCGCGKVIVEGKLLQMLDQARWRLGRPVIIVSGFRCYKHNLDVGGKSTSSHRYGLAVDIECENSRDRQVLLRVLRRVGFTRIGIAKTFIHVDIDQLKFQNVTWVY